MRTARTVLISLGGLGLLFLVVATSVLSSTTLWAQEVPGVVEAPVATGNSLPANIPVKRDADTPGPIAEGWGLVFIAVSVLLMLVVMMARGRTRRATARKSWWMPFQTMLESVSPQQIKRVSSTRLAPGHSLHEVLWNDQRLLVACSGQSIQLLAQAPCVSNSEQVPPHDDPAVPSTAP